ncbi:MAG: hypothetical protein WDN10_05420 [bacterium]
MNSITAKSRKSDVRLRAYVAEMVREVLDDPDFGLELSGYARRRLAKAKKTRAKGIPLSAILKKYS